jgi:mono/diheme cytochrome c family protein
MPNRVERRAWRMGLWRPAGRSCAVRDRAFDAGRCWAGIGLALMAACAGCQRSPELQFVSSELVKQLSQPLQEQIENQLTQSCGTPANPKLLGDETMPRDHLLRGAAVYQQRCMACHGVTGDGAGPAAEYMNPRPRDYRRGIFKFTSTPYGAKPRREDLLRTVRRGAKGTSMPSFALLPDEDIEAVVDYVLALTHRGELEVLLALEAETEDEIAPQRVPELIKEITDQWNEANSQVVLPLTKMPPYSPESIELGKQAFLSEVAGCVKCHGPDGRAAITENVEEFKDAWGHQTRAADLTSGMFHGGDRPDDIYRRIYAGINGTPMPSYDQKLSAQPETFWHLVHFVKSVSGERRRAVVEQAKEEGLPHASGD